MKEFSYVLQFHAKTKRTNFMRITFYLFLKDVSVSLCMFYSRDDTVKRVHHTYLINLLNQLLQSVIFHTNKSHFLAPQMYGCDFIAINQSIVQFLSFFFFQSPYVALHFSDVICFQMMTCDFETLSTSSVSNFSLDMY